MWTKQLPHGLRADPTTPDDMGKCLTQLSATPRPSREALLRNTHFTSTTRQLHCNTLSLRPSAELHESDRNKAAQNVRGPLRELISDNCMGPLYLMNDWPAFIWPVAVRPEPYWLFWSSFFFRMVLTAAGVRGIYGISDLRKRWAV